MSWVARSRSGSSSFTASALNTPSSSSSSSSATPANLECDGSPNEIDRLGVLHHEYNILSGLEDGRYRTQTSEHRRLLAHLGKPLSSVVAGLDQPQWTGEVHRLCPISNSFVARDLVVQKNLLVFSNRASGLCTDVIPVSEIRLVRKRTALPNDGTPLRCVAHLVSHGDHLHHDLRHGSMGGGAYHHREGDAWDRASHPRMGTMESTGGHLGWNQERYVLDVKTSEVGLNAGRCFTLMADTERVLVHLQKMLSVTREEALRTRRSNSSLYLNLVIIGRQIEKSVFFHRLQVVMIAISFLLCAVEAELQPQDETDMFRAFIVVEIFFIVWLTFEISLAFFVSVHLTFLTTWMNLLDVVLVCFSFWSVSDTKGPSSLRALRVVRVLRVAKRLLNHGFLRTIVTSLYKSFNPVMHVFILTFVMVSLYAILAASLFNDVEQFESFSKALFSVTTIATLDGWVLIYKDLLQTSHFGQGEGHWIIRLYMISYIVIVPYVLLNIVIAALLDAFIESRRDQDRVLCMRKMQMKREPIDSLLEELANACNDHDLRQRLHLLFAAFANEKKENMEVLTFERLSEGLWKLQLAPRIYLGLDDYIIITHQLALCRPDGSMTKVQFEYILLQQLRGFVLRNMRNAMGEDKVDSDGFGVVITGINHLLFDTQKLLFGEPDSPLYTNDGSVDRRCSTCLSTRQQRTSSPKTEVWKESTNEVQGGALQIASAQADVLIKNGHMEKSVDSRLQAVEQQLRDMNTLLARLAGAALPVVSSSMSGITSGGVETRNGDQALHKELCTIPNQDKSTAGLQIWAPTSVSSISQGGPPDLPPRPTLDLERSHPHQITAQIGHYGIA